ncbi:MAG: glucosamine--fructose-6-phosphate aminotransferase (isomerizing), partial [Parcubacteria group bacterium Greene0416_79]
MCGIIGYIGTKEALPVVLEGLTRMEYRGYDSAGIVILSPEGPRRIRAKGKVALLKAACAKETLRGTLGIGHTRWATHGEPSERNAHPHADCASDIFVTHNGIIENFQTLKTRLSKKGHRFASETDTEVIAHLIEEHAKKDKNFVTAVQSALRELRGAFGIVALSRQDPHRLVAARFGSPLILGIGKDEYVAASDVTAILPITNSVIYLNDGDLLTLTKRGYEISDFKNGAAKVERARTKIEWTSEAAEKGGFPHFMLKEIFEQPQSLRDTMRGRLLPSEGAVKFGGFEPFEKRLRALRRITSVAMGTARFTAKIGEYAIEELAGIPVKVEYGSEFSYRAAAVDEQTALLAVSQSGETADTLNAVKEAKRRGLLTLGIVNVIGSSIARAVDAGLYNHVGPEIAVAS